MKTSKTALIALGSNLSGDHGGPKQMLDAAFSLLESAGLRVKHRSQGWRTPAFPIGSGDNFVNSAAIIRTTLSPEDLLTVLHSTEQQLGRERRRRWGPRVIDLDLLAFGDLVLPDAPTVERWMALSGEQAAQETPDTLLLPHPRMHERGFVLAPLADIAPDWRHPLLGLTTRAMLAALPPAAMDGVAPLPKDAAPKDAAP